MKISKTHFEYQVSVPRDTKMKEVRAWLNEHVGLVHQDYDIVVDIEADNYFSQKNPAEKFHPNKTFFNIGFKREEDKVKFILVFL